MTMVPAQNKQNRSTNYVYRRGGYGGYNTTASFGGTTIVMSPVEVEVEVEGYNCLGSDLAVSHMAEDESRTNTSLNEAQAQAQAVSTSKESNSNNSSSWLQLSIGGCQIPATSATVSTAPTPTGSGLVELDLLPAGGHSWPSLESEIRGSPRAVMSYPGAGASSFSTSFPFQQSSMPSAPTPAFALHQQINWAFGPFPHNMGIIPSSSSSISSHSSSSCSSLRPLGSFFRTPFHFPAGFDVAGPSSDFLVVDPPRRPHSGIWFMLQASPNQAKEPLLPQIPKSYLRIKDGRMTVRLLLKYLVNKLRLESESEIEITCRGQQLLPFLTLQHVRDNIWTPGDAARTLLSGSSTTDHVMVLHYGRSA